MNLKTFYIRFNLGIRFWLIILLKELTISTISVMPNMVYHPMKLLSCIFVLLNLLESESSQSISINLSQLYIRLKYFKVDTAINISRMIYNLNLRVVLIIGYSNNLQLYVFKVKLGIFFRYKVCIFLRKQPGFLLVQCINPHQFGPLRENRRG